MPKKSFQVEDILNDLEYIYMQAMENGNLAVALKTKEILGREHGLFSQKKPPRKEEVTLEDLSDEDIKRLIEEIERKLGLDPAHVQE